MVAFLLLDSPEESITEFTVLSLLLFMNPFGLIQL